MAALAVVPLLSGWTAGERTFSLLGEPLGSDRKHASEYFLIGTLAGVGDEHGRALGGRAASPLGAGEMLWSWPGTL